MAKTKVIKHIHKYIRTSGKFTYVWKCGDPYCKHYIHGSQAYTIIGRISQCWGCGKPFPLAPDFEKDEMPLCPACENPDIAPIAEVMQKEEDNFPMNKELQIEEMRRKLIEMGVIHE